MSRNGVAAGQKVPATSPSIHRPSNNAAGAGRRDSDEFSNLDLFSNNRIQHSTAFYGMGKREAGRDGVEDLLEADLGKHDYDWLLTPPATPSVPLCDASSNSSSAPSAGPKRTPAVRSVLATRTSRISASQTVNGQSMGSTRSSSVTRSSIAFSYASNRTKTSVLTSSSASVTSAPGVASTPRKQPTSPSKPRAPTNRPASRSQTPVKAPPATSSEVKAASDPKQNSRSATPSSRSRVTSSSTSSNSSTPRAASRSSTPTRVSATRTSGTAVGRSPSVGRTTTSNTRTPQSGPLLHPRSASPQSRAPVHPIGLPDLPNDTPPNLRTKMSERSLSAGRLRQAAALTVRASPNVEATGPPGSNKKALLPVVARSKFPENSPKNPLGSNGNQIASPENHKKVVSEAGSRKINKSTSATESSGFGRTISKQSLDMAVRHMDIHQSLGGIRGASLFPHSIRSATLKAKHTQTPDLAVSVTDDEQFVENDISNVTNYGDVNVVLSHITSSIVHLPDSENLMFRDNDLDLYDSGRYDIMLLREDKKNTNWLRGDDEKSDQSSVFDHRFEPLPEPFDPL